MKNKLLLTLLALVCVLCCVFSFAACDPADNGDDGDNGDNVDTAEITAEKWSQAFTALAGSTNYTIAMGKDFVKLDGAKLHMKWEDGDMILAKEGSDYFVYLKEEGESAWQKSDGTEEEYNEYAAMYKTMVAAGANALKDKFSTFTYADGVYTAAKLDMGEDLGEVKNLKVKFNNGALVSVEFTATMDSADIAMSLKDLGATSVSLPQVEQPEPEKFSVIFKAGDTEVKTLSDLESGTKLTEEQIPQPENVPEDKIFVGWFDGEVEVGEGFEVNANVVAVAKLVDKFVTVTFKNGATVVKTLANLENGTELTAEQIPALQASDIPEGQVFVEWFTVEGESAVEVAAGFKVTANIEVNAAFGYSVKFQSLGATVKTLNVLEGTQLTAEQIPTVDEPGKVFQGWFVGEGDDAVKVEAGFEVAQNVTAVAKYEFLKYSVTFKVGDKEVDTVSDKLYYALLWDVPAIAEEDIPEDKVFLGWFVGEGDDAVEVIAGEYRITATVVAVAKFGDPVTIAEAFHGEWLVSPFGKTYHYTVTITAMEIKLNDGNDNYEVTLFKERAEGGYAFTLDYYGACELYTSFDKKILYCDGEKMALITAPFANATWASEDGAVKLVFSENGAVVGGAVQFDAGDGLENGSITQLEEGETLTIDVNGTTYVLGIGSSYMDVEIGDDYIDLNEVKDYSNTTWISQNGKVKLVFSASGVALNGAVQFDIDGSELKEGTITSVNAYGFTITVEGEEYEFGIYDSCLTLFGDDEIDLFED